MSLFKRKKKEKTKPTDVMIISNVNLERKFKLNELRVVIKQRNYTIFSDSTSKYLCFDNDFDNPITFEDYTESIQGTVILKRDDVSALLYYNRESNKYELTDFIFTNIQPKDNLLLLTTSDNKKYLYCYYAIYSDICDYVAYDLDEGFDLVLIKFHDHDELYKRYLHHNLNLLFSAKSIELCATISRNSLYNWKTIFKYTVDESDLVNYFIVDTGYLSDIQNENSYISLDVVNYCDDKAALIGTNECGKKCILEMYSPNEVSKYYDSIENTKNLFLCQEGNHVEIIDINFNVYYQKDFEADMNLSLLYDEVSDSFILNANDTKIISLHLYHNCYYDFYSIFEADEEYGTLYSFEPQVCLPEFIKICENNIFEFKDDYLKPFYDYYAFFKKDIIFDEEPYLLSSEHLKNIYFINADNETFYIGLSRIHLLPKCSVSEIESIYYSEKGTMIIEASNPICNIIISDYKIKVKVITGENMELNISDIKTNLIDYIFEHITNKFSIAYLQHLLKF